MKVVARRGRPAGEASNQPRAAFSCGLLMVSAGEGRRSRVGQLRSVRARFRSVLSGVIFWVPPGRSAYHAIKVARRPGQRGPDMAHGVLSHPWRVMLLIRCQRRLSTSGATAS